MLHGIAKIGTEFGPLNNSTAGLARCFNPSFAITLSAFALPLMGRKSPESLLLTIPSVTRCPTLVVNRALIFVSAKGPPV
jgi:hypothetical protein